MPAKHEEKPFTILPGRAHPRQPEDRLDDKHGRSLQTQHDPQPDWGRNMEDRLETKRMLPVREEGYGRYLTRKPSV